MTTDHDFDRIAQAWLLEGPTRIPDRAVDSALEQVRLTQQRPARWPARRSSRMFTISRLGAAAAIVVAVAVLANQLGWPGPGILAPTATPSPTIAPSPTPAPTARTFPLTDGSSIVFRISAPEGWVDTKPFVMQKNAGEAPTGMAIAVWNVGNVYREGCQWEGSLYDPQIGTTVEDLATALASLTDREVSAPVPVTIDGYSGLELEMTIPDVDFATCDGGQFRSWIDNFGGPRVHQGPLEHSRILILDIDTSRQLVFGRSWPGTSESDLAELNLLLDTMQIESPLAPTATP